MVAEVFAGVSAFKAMFDMAKTLGDASDSSKRDRLSINLQKEILAAQAAQSDLTEEIGRLKAHVASFEKWDAEAEKYELKNLGGGSFAYMLKPDARGTKPAHWVCTKCYSDRKIEIVQTIRDGNFRVSCPRCGSSISSFNEAVENGSPKWLD